MVGKKTPQKYNSCNFENQAPNGTQVINLEDLGITNKVHNHIMLKN
jgi:hypothetical protein